jgi:thiosulfate/3-mercaptopyruvate sulfurtransferase
MKPSGALAVVLVVAAPAAAEAAPRDKLLVSPAWLAQRLDDRDTVILQIGDANAYKAGHIPGARLLMLPEIAAPMGGEALTLELPDAQALHAKLTALGVSNRSRIVIVPTREAGIQSATRAVFTLDAAGLGSRTVLLDGGTAAWAAQGRPLSTEAPLPAATSRLAPIRYRPLIVDAAFVQAHASAPGYKVVDSRTPEFYSGARAGGSPARPHKAGHIAGAVSVPFSSVTTPDLKLASAEDIAARFKAAGVKRGDTVITYCHVGQQASATLFAARTLGLKVRLYDGSFEEWSRLGKPVETSTATPR